MNNQKEIINKGGTMRLGNYECKLIDQSIAKSIYQKSKILERHRHRFEFNNKYLKQYEKNGMKASGINNKSNLVEIIELDNHPFFIGVQFHPEYKSTVTKPHPIFINFLKAAINQV